MITNISDLKNNICGIYVICYDNNKYYVGQSVNIRQRALEHNYKNKQACDKALKKHDAVIQVLDTTDDIALLDVLEQEWICYYHATDKNYGYNILQQADVSEARGVKHPNAAFSQEQLDEVVDLLLNHTELSMKDIAQKYNVHPIVIFNISKGHSYYNPQLNYPLRQNNHEYAKKDDVFDYFPSVQILINLKEDLLYRWDLTIEEGLKEKYNIPMRILRDVNNGRKFADIGDFTYPIRAKNIRNNINFSQTDIQNILNLLRHTSISMTKIGEQYKIHRNTVSAINQGISYPIKNYQYPARETNK